MPGHRACSSMAAVIFAVLVGVPSHAAGQQDEGGSGGLKDRISSEEAKLEELREEIEQRRRQAQQLAAREKSISHYLNDLEREISLVEELIRRHGSREELLRLQVELLSTQLAREEEGLRRREERLAAWLRSLYMREKHSDLEILLSSKNLSEMLDAYRALSLIAARDKKLLDQMRGSIEAIQMQRSELTEAWSEIHLSKVEVERERVRLGSKERERKSTLQKIQSERKSHEENIADLERASEELKKLLEDLERRRREALGSPEVFVPGVSFTSLQGKLPMPVRGEISKQFGSSRHPHFGTVTFNNGIDIAADPGEPIRCVADGMVEYVSWLQGYGNCAIVNHGDGFYTLYAHASRVLVEVGEIVDAGAVIGEVGDTGSLDGYKLHFEIRKSKNALDPADWIRR